MNTTFREWINLLKIEEAKRLLAEYSDMDISEVSAKAGFVNSSHFGRQFRQITRATPGEWRKKVSFAPSKPYKQ
jgi:two-component system response regulator YesN